MYKRKGRSNLREEKEGEITEKKNLDESKFHFNSIRRIDEKVEKASSDVRVFLFRGICG